MSAAPPTHRITSEAEISEILGEPPDFVRAKVADRLDRSAARFVARATLAFVAIVDAQARLDVSPKGDVAGSFLVPSDQRLLLPERTGNRLAFGLRNILATGRIAAIFVVPGQRETLRVNGSASLTRDPELLQRLAARGKPALLCTEVHVEECFFHCGKALIRSGAWAPETWDADLPSQMVAQVVDALGGDVALTPTVAAQLERNYVDDL